MSTLQIQDMRIECEFLLSLLEIDRLGSAASKPDNLISLILLAGLLRNFFDAKKNSVMIIVTLFYCIFLFIR